MTLFILLSYGSLCFALGCAFWALVDRMAGQDPTEPPSPEPPSGVRMLPVSRMRPFDFEREVA